MSSHRELSADTSDDNKLIRPKAEFHSLLQHAGATKDIFTMKELMFYLGQYIMKKQLYDQKQQHIVHCAQDALGQVLGIDSFSVKEPGVLFAMITKNLVAVKSQESSPSLDEPQSNIQTDRVTEEADSERCSSSPDRRRWRWWWRSSDPGPSNTVEDDENEEEEEEGGKKRRRSDSYSLTFDDRLSWCVIGGLGSVHDRHNSQSSESHSTSSMSEVTVAASDSDNFSVEFEVESIDSDDYNEDDALLSADDQENEGIDVPDGKRVKTPPPLSRYLSYSTSSASNFQDLLSSASSQDKLLTSDSQPSSSSSSSIDSQELLPSSPASAPPVFVPELEHSVSEEWRLPELCLDPCLICQSRPKNGCIVHGRTGHLISCYVCARKLKKRNKLCPACRLPIQCVILTYLC
ncbi:E3 ubiquitin-protein ligase Mdm2-like [Anabas testudineus]|uniref:E3 ubiquitin-protein ligase Mdm2-like n=1 Tax=Anabas testudineus TaxID=64144 RepID=UPI000E456BE3|nr:E3 ubiquitin-protein ligase Mdm2-like [Anabas testudineus]